MTQNDQAAMNEQLTQLRLQGLSIDGDNRYKQDLIDAIIGAMIFGAQGANPPPAGHCLEQFYVIVREEREALARVETERDAVLAKAPTQWAYDQACTALHKHRELANTAQAQLREVDAYLSGHGDNAICNGSRLHRDIKDLLAGQIAVAGTTSDQYRAELYDEVWEKARDMGYGNVTDALVALESMKAALPEPVAIANRGKGAFWVRWTDAAEGLYGPGIKLYAAPPAAAHGHVPSVSGIGRDAGHPRALVLYLRSEPTDDDIRAIQEALRGNAAAHGDEAVLDVLKTAYESGYQDGQDAPNAYSDEKVKHRIALSLLEEMMADAAMRAQGDGGSGDA